MKIVKVCKFCGKEFVANSNRQIYCKGPHYRKCPICNKQYLETKSENLKFPPKACSYSCRAVKTRNTSIAKYGVPAPGNNPEARKRASETMLSRYGVPYAMMSKDILEKSKQTNMLRYGYENVSKSPEIINKRKITNKLKYGNILPFNRPESYEKQRETMMKKYGYKSFVETPQFTESYHNLRNSGVNQHFSNWLLDHDISHQNEYRIDIPGGTFYIYDFYIPMHNLLVEINPTITHSSKPTFVSKGLPKEYHKNKTSFGRWCGYNVMNIWDWDEKTVLLKYFKPIQNEILADDCRIFKLYDNIGKGFIEKYSPYGNCRGQVLFVGLIYKNELVQVLSFKKPHNKLYSAQIARLCTKSGYRVINGYSKLLKFASNTYQIQNIVAYNDLSKFSGRCFASMGMKLHHINSPAKLWYNPSKKIRLYDQNFQHQYNSVEELKSLNFLPIYTCGQSVYVYTNL